MLYVSKVICGEKWFREQKKKKINEKADGEHEKWAQCFMLCKHFIALKV